MGIAIRVANLTKSFARSAGYLDLLPWRTRQMVTAVEGLNFEIQEGELFGLLGPNGAGKTTLLRLLCGIIVPSSGTASVFGHDVQKDEQAVKERVGLVTTDERSFYWRLTGWQNLEFHASLYGVPRGQSRQRIADALTLVGLATAADMRFQSYSTGMRQKLAIARGLLSQPRVLFVDEPTRSLDPISAQAVRTFLKEQTTKAGRTVLLATHNMEEAEAICDRVAIMDHGRIVASGPVSELRFLFQKQERCDLEVKNPPEGLIDRLLETHGVLQCQRVGQRNGTLGLELMLSDRAAALPAVLRLIIQGGGEVCNCSLKEIPLEEIFMRALEGGTARRPGNVCS